MSRQELEMDYIFAHSQKLLPNAWFRKPHCRIREESDDFVLRMHSMLAGQNILDEEIRFPADWWEAVKMRWMPKWMRRRWPVRFTRYSFRAHLVFPDVKTERPAGRYQAINLLPGEPIADDEPRLDIPGGRVIRAHRHMTLAKLVDEVEGEEE